MFQIEYRAQGYFVTISGSRGIYRSNVAIYEDSSFDLLQKSYKKRLIVNPLDKNLFTKCIEVEKIQGESSQSSKFCHPRPNGWPGVAE